MTTPDARVVLEFAKDRLLVGDDVDIRTGLSCVVRDGDDLWLACDEGCRLERLSRSGSRGQFSGHTVVPLDDLAVDGLRDGHRGVAAEDLCDRARVIGIEVDDDDERTAAVGGHLVEEPLERHDPAGGGTETDHDDRGLGPRALPVAVLPILRAGSGPGRASVPSRPTRTVL